jgi:hypothetical protein
MPLRTLSLFAQRVGRVLASASTWARLVHDRGWRRPRLRVHPAKPTVGVRATRPNELWHIDVSVLKLPDGTSAFIHAVMDNFSRKILAWTIGARLDPTATCGVLVEAGKHLAPAEPRPAITVMADSGVENVNAAVDATLLAGGLHRVVAQVEVTESSSMIEAWWPRCSSARHQPCLWSSTLHERRPAHDAWPQTGPRRAVAVSPPPDPRFRRDYECRSCEHVCSERCGSQHGWSSGFLEGPR